MVWLFSGVPSENISALKECRILIANNVWNSHTAAAMHALSIPTTRSLALVSLPELPVIREEMETACILTRVAPSFIRIGSFEALNPPDDVFLFGGQQPRDLEALRILGEWVGRSVLRIPELVRDGSDDKWGKSLVFESARRNAKMVAAWQCYGFMHGVINTDKQVPLI